MNLSKLSVQELNTQEMKEVEGGLIPPLILAAWGAMAIMDCAAVGLYLGYHNNR